MPLEAVDTYTYVACTTPLRDWMRLQPRLAGICGQRIYASIVPRGASTPALSFHRYGGGIDWTLDHSMWQFDCWAPTPDAAEGLAATLASVLMSVQGRTSLGTGVILHGATPTDLTYLPEAKTGNPRMILRAALTFASF